MYNTKEMIVINNPTFFITLSVSFFSLIIELRCYPIKPSFVLLNSAFKKPCKYKDKSDYSA